MKSVLALTAFVLGLGVNANAEIQGPVTSVQPFVLAEVQNPQIGTKSVALMSTGEIQLTNLAGKKTLISLNEGDIAALTKEASDLAYVNVINEHHLAICMMMPVGPQMSLYVEGRLILSPTGCYLADETLPEKSSDQKLAERLEQDLVAYVPALIVK